MYINVKNFSTNIYKIMKLPFNAFNPHCPVNIASRRSRRYHAQVSTFSYADSIKRSSVGNSNLINSAELAVAPK